MKLEVNLSEETVWLTQKQMAELFDKDQNTINDHINNIFKEGELDENTSTGISASWNIKFSGYYRICNYLNVSFSYLEN